jgi:hypothetical protein
MFNLPAATDTVAADRQWRLRRQARDQQAAEQVEADDSR